MVTRLARRLNSCYGVHMLRKFVSIFALTGLLASNILPSIAQAQVLTLDVGFDPNHVLEDDDIFDVKAMTFERMVDFLRSKGTLADYRTVDTDGSPKTAAEIIWRVAMTYKINPKYLLALLQKEQSLVEDPNPDQKQFDWATGYAICDNCSKDDPSVQEFKGFASQVEWAAKQHREKYLLQILSIGTTRAGKAAGKEMTLDGMSVTPVNNATAMLYSYTPHIHGNLNLWRIWRRWFSMTYPDGTVVRGKNSGKTYLIRMGEKRPFASPAVVQSLVNPDKIVTVSETELSAYPDGATIRFPKFALLRDSKKRIWLLTGDSKRHIQTMKAFRKFGFNEDEVEDVTDEDLADYPIEEPITETMEFPQGVVIQDSVTKTYWYVEGGVKHLLSNKIFLTLYFKGRTVRKATTAKLDTYEDGTPYRFANGELVRGKTASSVYVVENGVLRPIPSGEIFESVGWKWSNVVTVPDEMLQGYTVGTPYVPGSAAPVTVATL